MSGVTGDNPYRASGVIAAAAAGGLSWQAVETGSTMTAEAGNAYWIDTTSNICTITLPSSASNGDQMIFADYDRTWGTYSIFFDSNGLNYQGEDDSSTVEYSTTGQSVHIVYSDATNGWIPVSDDDVDDKPVSGNDNGCFAMGVNNSWAKSLNTNLVSNTGVMATDVSYTATGRSSIAATEYGGDKGIFAYGSPSTNLSNLVSNAGVVATDTAGVGTARAHVCACAFGGDKGLFGFGSTPNTAITNLVSNTGVVASDTAGVGTARAETPMATEYGGDKGIVAYGYVTGPVSMSNLVSNTGVVATDTPGVGTARMGGAACGYAYDKGIFAFGAPGAVSLTNLVSNTGVIASDVAGVAGVQGRASTAGTEYGMDKGIFAYGYPFTASHVSNLLSNTGVMVADVAGVGSEKGYLAACGYN